MDDVEEIHLQKGDSWMSDENLIRVPKYYSELEANPDKWVLHRYFLVMRDFCNVVYGEAGEKTFDATFCRS